MDAQETRAELERLERFRKDEAHTLPCGDQDALADRIAQLRQQVPMRLRETTPGQIVGDADGPWYRVHAIGEHPGQGVAVLTDKLTLEVEYPDGGLATRYVADQDVVVYPAFS